MRLFKIFSVLFFFISYASFGQTNDDLYSRLNAISNGKTDFFNVDGIDITSQALNTKFTKKNILKKFYGFRLKESDLNSSDSLIDFQNFYVEQKELITDGIIQNTSYYFIENFNKGLTAITFVSINKQDRNFEREFVKKIYENSIPKEVYEQLKIDSINFAGRKISLDGSCRWMGINNVQCPTFGQMNWSVHKTLEDALQNETNQYNIIKSKKDGQIISEEIVDIVFEGTEVKSKKVVYDFKGINSVLVGISGGKTLTIYFVAAPVRENFVSCVLSFWNNDNINPSGLPPLLEEVMRLKN
ncbi:MAG: hypothetical protein ABI208_08895 [Ginsengibacter sp.]